MRFANSGILPHTTFKSVLVATSVGSIVAIYGRYKRNNCLNHSTPFRFASNFTEEGMFGCPWAKLGVPKGCSQDVLHKEYVKLCKKHHPDAGGTSASFHTIRKAYDTCTYQLKEAADMNAAGVSSPQRTSQDGAYSGVGFQDENDRAEYRSRMRKQLRTRFQEVRTLNELQNLFRECLLRQLFVEKDAAEPLTRTLQTVHRFVGLGEQHWKLCRELITEWEDHCRMRASSTLFNDILTLYAEDQWVMDEDGVELLVPVHDVEEVVTSVLEHMSERGIEPDDWSVTLARFALRKQSPANHGPAPKDR